MTVARNRSPNLGYDVFIAIVVQVRESDPMTFVQFARTAGCGYVSEVLAVLVVKQNIGKYIAVWRGPGTQVEIEEAVIVDIPEIGSHRVVDMVESNLFSNVAKRSIVFIVVELHGLDVIRKM